MQARVARKKEVEYQGWLRQRSYRPRWGTKSQGFRMVALQV